MGLERTASVMQGVDTNFHIDTLRPIVELAGQVCRTPYEPASDAGRRLRRITDHVRACTMAIHENVYPGPNKEKYVVRRLLRRAVLDGHQLGMREPFLHKLVPLVVDMMKTPYPELADSTQRISGVIRQEEESTLTTIDSGLPRAERLLDQLQQSGSTTLDGQQAAQLYSTYGFPPELLETLASERRIAFDWGGFQQALRVESDEAHGLFKEGPIEQLKKTLQATEFLGYDVTDASAEIKGLVKGDTLQNELSADPDQDVVVVLDRSPFYGEAGGQVGDVGVLDGQHLRFEVRDTQREGSLLLHYGRLVQGRMRTGDRVRTAVDASRREGIRRAHSATHILHYALQKNLGSHAQQQGSKVDEDWLRFDFTNLAPVDAGQIDRIEADVHQRIKAGERIGAQVIPLAEARKHGAMMLFGEKYPDPVRMISMGDFSRELCGGTHLDSTAAVTAFEIITEEGVSAGTRRVVAVTGPKAQQHREQTIQAAQTAAGHLGCDPQQLPQAVRVLIERVRDLKKQLAGSPARTEPLPRRWPSPASSDGDRYTWLRAGMREAARLLNVALFDVPDRIASLLEEMHSAEQQLQRRQEVGTLSADRLLQEAQEVDGTQVIVAEIPLAGANLMRQLIDQVRRKVAPSAVLLASAEQPGKVMLVAGVSRELVDRGLSAGEWVKAVAPAVDGGGGGRPDMAQAGGKSAEKIPQALKEARDWIRLQLAG
jgi:alanyl-tRNA synthetase